MHHPEKHPLATSDGGRIMGCVGGRGAAVIRVVRNPSGVGTVVLASRRASAGVPGAAAALREALADAGVRRVSVPIVVGEVLTRAQLIGTPPLKGADLRRAMQNQLGPDETFVDVEAGVLHEGTGALPARFVVSASREDLRQVVDAAESPDVGVEAVWSLDRLLMEFARLRLGAGDEGLRVAAIVEPHWTHIVCLSGGRAIFVRRAEASEELSAADRAGTVVAEIQRTVLVVRGRLRPPPLVGAVLFDPLSLVPEDVLREAADGAGLSVARDAFTITTGGNADSAALGDALRAAIAEVVRDARADRRCRLDCATRATRRVGRIRRAAAAALLAAAWGSAWAVQARLDAEGAKVAAALAASVPDEVAEEAAREALERDAVSAATLRRDHAPLFRYVAATGGVAPVLRRLAVAAPDGVALTRLEILAPKSGSSDRSVRIEGFASGGLTVARDALRTLHARCEGSPGFAGDDLPEIVGDPFARDPSSEPIPFAWAVRWKDGPP